MKHSVEFDRITNDIIFGTGATMQNGNEIWAMDCSLGDQHVFALSESAVPIEHLMAAGTRITDRCLAALCELPLIDLSIANTSVTSAAVLTSTWPETLTNFSLSGISFRTQCLKKLAQLPRLSVLDISGCRITPTQLHEICDGSSVSFILAARNRIFGTKAREVSLNWPQKRFCFSDGIWEDGCLAIK